MDQWHIWSRSCSGLSVQQHTTYCCLIPGPATYRILYSSISSPSFVSTPCHFAVQSVFLSAIAPVQLSAKGNRTAPYSNATRTTVMYWFAFVYVADHPMYTCQNQVKTIQSEITQWSKRLFTDKLKLNLSNHLIGNVPVCIVYTQACVHFYYMWQSRIETKYYSVVYFECITEFNVL